MEEKELKILLNTIKDKIKSNPKNKNLTEDQIDKIILDGYFDAFTKGEIDAESLLAIAQALGYEPSDEFVEALKKNGDLK